MRIFGRRRPAPVAAELTSGFWLAEAQAMQGAIRGALTGLEGGEPVVAAELTFDRGRGDRVVATWRNLIVGFVPDSHLAELSRQLAEATHGPLVAPATVHLHGGERRIWAGPPWPGEQPPPYPEARVAPAPPHIFGVQIRSTSAPPE